MSYRPLVGIAVAYIWGLWLARLLPTASLWFLLLAVFLWLFAYIFWRAPRRPVWWFFLLLGVTAVGIGIGAWDVGFRQSQLKNDRGTYLDITGIVIGAPQVYPNREVYTLLVQAVRQDDYYKQAKEKVQLVLYGQEGTKKTKYVYGDILDVHGRLTEVPRARNPGEFNYRSYLERRYIYNQILISDPQAVIKLGSRLGNPLLRLALIAKDKGGKIIATAVPSKEAGILQALLFGDREGLEENDLQTFKDLGVMHVFATSGLHVGFVILFLMTIAGLLGLPRQAAVALGLAGLLFYAALAGFSPSINRAAIMGGLGLWAYLRGEQRDFYTALSLAALVILLLFPRYLYDSGFQLSFVAAWGIVYLHPFFDELLSWLPGWRRYLLVPLAAQLATLPLVIYYFGYLPLLGLVANLIAVGLVGVIVILGLITFVAALVWPLVAIILATSAGLLINILLFILSGLATLPGITLPLAMPAPWTVLIFYITLIALREFWLQRQEPHWLALWRWHRRKLGLLAVLTLATLIVYFYPIGKPGELQVTFIDVGQGDAVLLTTPSGRRILVDGGGGPHGRDNFDVGEKIVVPFLYRQGIRSLDVVVSTHPDVDHLAGLFAVVRQLPVTLVVVPPLRGEMAKDYTSFLAELKAANVPWQEAGRGMAIAFEPEMDIRVLHPGDEIKGTKSDGNNNSLVLKITYGDISILLSADIELEAMEDLLNAKVDVACDIFKIPHHGSRYGLQPNFLAQVAAQAAVVSVGEKNNFGHPATEIIDYWQERGIPVYRTDQQGAITFRTDGQGWMVETFL